MARGAGDPTPATPPPDKTPVVLEPLVVSEKLDKAREAIVPSLGAAEFHLDRAQIDAQALGSNASFSDVLLHVPGVAADSFGQIHVRGEHADLQYRINDVLLPEGLTGFGQELDTRFVDTVSVLTGALPAQYGYRTAGVVDIHTRTAARAGSEVTAYGGSFDTLRGSVEATAGHAAQNVYITASAERTDLGVENPTPARAAIHDRKNEAKAFAYGSLVLNDSNRVTAMVSTSFSRFQIPNNPGQTPVFSVRGAGIVPSANLDENQREENHYAILALQHSTSDFSAQVSAFGRYSLVAFAPDRVGDLEYNGVASRVRRALAGDGLEADAKWDIAPTHTLRAGALVTATNVAARSTTSVFPIGASGAPTSDVAFDIADSRRKLGWLAGAYGQDEWKPSERWTVNYGFRADTAHGDRNEAQLSPRVNVVYQASDDTALHFGYARYFTPAPIELIAPTAIGRFAGTTNEPAVATNSPVRAERAHYFDTGVSTKLARSVTATLDAYLKEGRNVLDEGQFGQALVFSPFNFRKSRTYGVELTGNYTHEALTVYANIALSRTGAREITSGEFQFDPDELGYIAAHDVHPDHDQLITASAGGSYRLGRTLFFADALYGSGLRRGFANTEHLPAYSPVNVGVQHSFELSGRRELRVRVDVVNAFDEVYELRDGSGIGVGAPQFGSRRAIYGGVTLAF